MSAQHAFDYHAAFSRTLGWVTTLELQQLRHKRVAIAGAGGVGGVHLLTLARLGIGAFNIADLDTFELANFNRQAGAMMSTLGQPKVEVMATMARDINPELDLRVFPGGINAGNVEDFLHDVDLYIDALDFFAFEARTAVFAACARLDIPAITVAPLGMGAALINFLPGQMTFEQYFGIAGKSDADKTARFLVGLAPGTPLRHYLIEPHRSDTPHRRGPSTPMSVQLCAGVAGSEAVKILLKRGRTWPAPHSITYDAFLNRHIHCWRPGGRYNPYTRLQVWLVSRYIQHQAAIAKKSGPAQSDASQDTMSRILDLARWAPSGDNEQPWRFEVRSETRLVVHFLNQHADNLYNYAGRPSLISLGCLAENLRLAASRHGWSMAWQYQPQPPGGLLQVDFDRDAAQRTEPLCEFIALRSVDRRPYRRVALETRQKLALEQALGDEFRVCWLEGTRARWQCSRLNASASRIRQGLPEAIRVHRRILDWDHDYSTDRIPVRAVGVSAPTRGIMQWVMRQQKRAEFMLGQLPGGTLAAQLEMELLPGMQCAAHFMLVRNAPAEPDDPSASIRTGMALQRFWLTATKVGLALHPSVATLCFAYYGHHQASFSRDASALPRARRLALRFDRMCLENNVIPELVVFLGRIGTPLPQPAHSRSVRMPLADLMMENSTPNPG
ncbi:tRNA threonylcarbamoyladenosine dehydratase [mine drainage metagenome]|uniref:tRNA threonylcarbamoyladenosine dehydratase n=1 Tax=mine drainage metagenome TaxID=410659 RepID=A0A1J5Q684_9ZZZZ